MDKKQRRLAEQKSKYAHRLAFSKFVENLLDPGGQSWKCCGGSFGDIRQCHKHVSSSHNLEVQSLASTILEEGTEDAKWKPLRATKRAPDSVSASDTVVIDGGPCKKAAAVATTGTDEEDQLSLPTEFTDSDDTPWLPKITDEGTDPESQWEVLLFYKYREITNTAHVRGWQDTLCQRLQLTGKVRVSPEGLNVTVCGRLPATQCYIKAVLAHPLFRDMKREDFKTSEGDANSFHSLKVGVHAEAVPMAISPLDCSYKDGGAHVSPEEFHEAMERYLSGELKDKAVFVDCRNFYESKVGKFSGALTPDIRKFSYWPEYVDKNEEVFRDKQVYMYCTGGIRCERGSAYIKNKGLTDNVFQLKGGIHKYMEQFPDGHFRGKLFVFDNRYGIMAKNEVIAKCSYCGSGWDDYTPCSSDHCHQLVLSCDACKQKGHTACCHTCQQNTDNKRHREECECTKNRERVPKEDIKDS